MESRHPGDHPGIDRAVDPAAEGLPAAPKAAPGLGDGARDVGDDLLERGEGVDGPGVAGEGDELEQRLVQARRRGARPEGGADLATQLPLAPLRGGGRDAGES